MQILKKSHFPLISHFTHSKERNQLCVPVKLPDMGSQRCNKCLWEFLCDKLQEPPLTAKSVFPVCIGEVLVSTQTEFWLANLIYECRRGCVCLCVCVRANVDALRPHMLLQELGYALLPSDQQRVLASSSCHLAICPLHQRQFPFLSLGLKRNDTCETNCLHSFVSICQYKKPSHPFQKYNCAGSLFPIIRQS